MSEKQQNKDEVQTQLLRRIEQLEEALGRYEKTGGQQTYEKGRFPPGGITPVFNEVTILLAVCPNRPAPEEGLEEVQKYAVCERLLMQAPIDRDTGMVKPTLFHRSDTFVDPNTGLRTQLLMLLLDPPNTVSKIFGGELGMNVRPPLNGISNEMFRGFPQEALDAFRTPMHHLAVVPAKPSIGKIQALQPDSDFPARVSIPVYYAFVSGGLDGKLSTTADNFSIEAKEPHSMEAVVMSVPPDPDTCVSASEWNLVDDSAYLKIWVKVECFRFLSIGDWNHRERLTYRNGAVVSEKVSVGEYR
jgi:hypothetical protein